MKAPRARSRWLIRKPLRVEIDGADAKMNALASGRNFSILLLRGQHRMTIQTE